MVGAGRDGILQFLAVSAAAVGAGVLIPAPHSPQPHKVNGIDALLSLSPFGAAFAPLVGLRLSLVQAPELSGRGRRRGRGRGSRRAVGIGPGRAGMRRLVGQRLDLDSRFLSGVH